MDEFSGGPGFGTGEKRSGNARLLRNSVVAVMPPRIIVQHARSPRIGTIFAAHFQRDGTVCAPYDESGDGLSFKV